MSLSHLDQDRAKLMAVTRTGTSLGSPYSVGLWSGSRLEGDLHPRWEQVPHSHGRPSVAESGLSLPQVSRLALSGLRNWTTAASPSAVFAARHFRPFLPPQGQELGEPWWIIPSELSVFTGYLSNNRFYPPPPKGKEVRDLALPAQK